MFLFFNNFFGRFCLEPSFFKSFTWFSVGGLRLFAILLETLVIVQIRKEQVLLQIVQIKLLQKLIKWFASLLDFNKELLCMGSRLCACTRAYVLLDFAPLFPVEFESLQKTEMLFFCPTALLQTWSTFHNTLPLFYPFAYAQILLFI